MSLNTQQIWKDYGDEFYFFILKKVKDEEVAKEVLQNSFFKIHKSLQQLKEDSKARAWSYQIVRNEISNYHKKQQPFSTDTELKQEPMEFGLPDSYCCFEKFLQKLPEKYFLVVQEVYLKGQSQQEAAANLGISLANTKARIRRAKEILKKDFQDCCKYQLDSKGLLTGEPDCSSCKAS